MATPQIIGYLELIRKSGTGYTGLMLPNAFLRIVSPNTMSVARMLRPNVSIYII
jgi:hypothetical protein